MTPGGLDHRVAGPTVLERRTAMVVVIVYNHKQTALARKDRAIALWVGWVKLVNYLVFMVWLQLILSAHVNLVSTVPTVLQCALTKAACVLVESATVDSKDGEGNSARREDAQG